MKKNNGQLVVIRAQQAGVWHGTMTAKTKDEVTLTDARRLWSWTGALSCSEIAVSGVTGGKIAVKVPSVILRRSDCVEILATSIAVLP